MSQRQRKTASSHAKPLKAPGLHRKVQSSTHLHTQSQQSGHRPTLGGNKRASTYVVDYGEDEESGSASFPQFWFEADVRCDQRTSTDRALVPLAIRRSSIQCLACSIALKRMSPDDPSDFS